MEESPPGHLDALRQVFELQTIGFTLWGDLGSPFYGGLGLRITADLTAGGPFAELFTPYAQSTLEDACLLRFLGGVHHRVLAGSAPQLEAHYPSTGGDGDVDAAFDHIRAMAVEPPPEVLEALGRAPQTNEVARSAALASGLAVVARDTALPIHLREIGTSAGLNQRLDAYHYEQDGLVWGDPQSRVRFVGWWHGGTPPFDARPEILDRRGCDTNPIDLSDEVGARWLLSYTWPEPSERFERASAAIAMAAADPPTVERRGASEWLESELAGDRSGSVLVVQHSLVFPYLNERVRHDVEIRIRAAGATATPDAPLAWLRLEPTPGSYLPARLELTVWDGTTPDPSDRLLATTAFHGGPIHWLDAG